MFDNTWLQGAPRGKQGTGNFFGKKCCALQLTNYFKNPNELNYLNYALIINIKQQSLQGRGLVPQEAMSLNDYPNPCSKKTTQPPAPTL